MTTVTIGTDPEICLVNQSGEVVPSGALFDWMAGQGMDIIMPPEPEEGMPPKGRKYHMAELGGGFYLYEDGASLEINVPPTLAAADMVNNLYAVLKIANHLATTSGYAIDIKASLPITEEVIKRGGVALSRFGCDPDQTAWDDRYDPSKIDAKTCYNRFYGGHIHIGTPEGCDEEFYYDNRWEMSVACDTLLGLTDVCFDHSPEAKTRRSVYGRIGRHRIQHYSPGCRGYEYRVPSNGWLRNPFMAQHMFKLGQAAAIITANGDMHSHLMGLIDLDTLKRAINTTDYARALNLYLDSVRNPLRDMIESFPDLANLGIEIDSPMLKYDLEYWKQYLTL